MQIDRPGRDSERGPAEQFTGSVWTDVIAAPSQSSPVAVYSVHFAPGARTAWHAHPAGQVLHVTEGAGLVQVRGQRPEEIRAGDAVKFNVTRHGGYDERTLDEVLDHYAHELGKLAPFPPATAPGN